jgi:plastocyanin
MRLRKRCLLAATVLGLTAMVSPTIASSAPLPVEAVNEGIGIYGTHSWSNSQQAIAPGEKVTFRNPYTTTYHGLKFTGGPATSCSGIPQMAAEPIGAFHWEGECTFSTPGIYTFICTVHPTEMKGTITVTNGEPTVTAEAAGPVTEREATLKGTVNPNGKTTEYFFKWGTTEAYGEKTSVTSVGAGTTGVAATATLSGLVPATTYHFRLIATNEKGPAEGPDQTFTTVSPPGPPSATTGVASSIGETAATLKGTVNPDGRHTEYFFEWGATEAYGQVTTAVPSGEDHLGHAATATLSSLSPGTAYHFRMVARNASSETASGADQTFMTLSPATTITQTPPASTTPLVAPLPPKLEEPPASGPVLVAGSLKLSAPRHASAVRATFDIGQAGVGGSFEADLLAKGVSLGRARGSKSVRVGRLVRTSVSSGHLSFSVALSSRARRALARRHSLALIVRITLTPPLGPAQTLTRSLTLRS